MPLITMNSIAMAQEAESVTVIKPIKKVIQVNSAAIDTESIELGLFFGNMSVADFGTNPVSGLDLIYHISDDFIGQLRIGETNVGSATFEEVIGLDFLSDKDQRFKFTQISVGYQLFHGRSFINAKNRFSTHIYLTAGIEKVKFAGNDDIGFVFGSSYKVVATDWLTLSLNLQDHVFNRSFLGENKTTNNVEFSVSFSALF